MYSIHKNTLNSILSRKFGTLVGKLCQKIEEAEKSGDVSPAYATKFKEKILKEYAYDTMREIKGQIGRFSEGVNIIVNLQRPTSEKK